MNTLSLNGPWELAWRDPKKGLKESIPHGLRKGRWIPAQVPGEIHLDLMRSGIVQEPLYGRNAEKQTWIEDKDWWFRREFVIDNKTWTVAGGQSRYPLPTYHAFLRFEGLDCTADIWLNGVKIGKANNAFHKHEFGAGKALKPGKNILVVRLDSGIFYSQSKDWKKYARRNESHREWIRKAQFSFKWDWAPRLLNVGMWRPVTLVQVEKARLRDVQLNSKLQISNGKSRSAKLEVRFTVENVTKKTIKLEARAALLGGLTENALPLSGGGEGGDAIGRSPSPFPPPQGGEGVLWLKAKPGRSKHRLVVSVKKPQLWWPNGQGEPYLYQFALGLFSPSHPRPRRGRGEGEGETLLDNYVCEHGFRTIRLLQEPLGAEGKSFTLEINGRKVFLKGANWVPVDSILPRITAEKYKKLVDMAIEANFNCFRIWGGGIYEDPEFWKACDRRGIMVWHDFMYACGMYPDDHKEFRDNVRAETEAVVKEIRNHPSLVLWSGNNENQEGYRAQWLGNPGHPFYGKEIFYKIIPELLAKEDPSRPWWPGSPVSSMEPPHDHKKGPRSKLSSYMGDFPDSEEAGDRHSWHTLGALPQAADYRLWAKDHGKMISEFGWLSEPNVETRDAYTPKNERKVDSPTYKFHDNPFNGGRINAALEAYGRGLKVSDEDRALHSQLIQGDALTYAISHFRRRMHTCSGTIFWMYSDCWGAPGWTIVDYYLRRKASFWALKRVFEPRLLSLQEDGHGFNIWLTNELDAFEGNLEFGISDFAGNTLSPCGRGKPALRSRRLSIDGEAGGEGTKVLVPANSSRLLASMPCHLRDWSWPDRAFAWACLRLKDGSELRAHAFWKPPLQLNLPPAKLTVKKLGKPSPFRGEGRERGMNLTVLEISSPSLALAVHFDSPLVAEGTSGVTVSDNYFDLLPGERKKIWVSGNPGKLSASALNSAPVQIFLK